MTDKIIFSVIIPVYNEEKHIRSCLNSVLNQDYPKESYEVLVVNDGSTDNTPEILKEFEGIKILNQKNKGPAAARNFGVREAQGECVVFTDGDCEVPRNWLQRYEKLFNKYPDYKGIGGFLTPKETKNIVSRFIYLQSDLAYDFPKEPCGISMENFDYMGTANIAYKRDVFISIGGFSEKFRLAGGEDADFTCHILESGKKLLTAPNLNVQHNYADNINELRQIAFSRGSAIFPFMVNRGVSRAKVVKSTGVRTLSLFFLSTIFLSFFWTPLIYVFLAYVFLIIYIWRKLIFFGEGVMEKIIFAFCTLLTHFYSTLGFFYGMLNLYQSRTKNSNKLRGV